jgi:hypothetical protein
MKKSLFSAAILLASFGASAQSGVFFSEYIEGSSNNKALEIFNGTGSAIDLGDYRLVGSTNGGGWAPNYEFQLPDGVMLNDGEVYVLAHGQADPAILAQADTIVTQPVYYNGDDARGIEYTNDGGTTWTLIDVIGNPNVDPGSGWSVDGFTGVATKEHTIVRKATVTTGSTDTLAWNNGTSTEWTVNPQNDFSNLGQHTMGTTPPPAGMTIAFAQAGPLSLDFFSTDLPATEDLAFSITNPTTGSFAAVAVVSPSNDTTLTPNVTSPFTLNITEFGTYMVAVSAVELPFNIIHADTIVVNVSENTIDTVATLADLRSGTVGNYYYYTGEALVTYSRSFRNQKYIQDNTAAILIDDNEGNITSSYNRYDGIQNVKGKLSEYKNMLQFVPMEDVTPSSTGNTFTPAVVTIADYKANYEEYEAECIEIIGGRFTDTGQFTEVTNYDYHVGTDTTVFRTIFGEANYIGMNIFSTKVDATVIPTQYNSYQNITARDSNDLKMNTVGIEEINETEVSIYPNPATTVLNIEFDNSNEKDIALVNSIGKFVFIGKANQKAVISTADLAKGIYTVLVKENGKVTHKKVAIQ